MATGTTKAPTDGDQSCCATWTSVRPEVGLPGYWNSLDENCAEWAEYVSVWPFWEECDKRRPTWSNEFHQKTGGPLLARNELPRFCGKQHPRIQKKIEQLTRGAKV